MFISCAHSRTHLISKLLNEDEGADEDVCIGNILLERLKVVGVAQLLQQVAHDLEAYLLGASVRCGEGRRWRRAAWQAARLICRWASG
eukprot:12527-Chlamydomonas_euryale.AAC.5